MATTVASDWLANELAEHGGEIDAAYRDRIVMHLMTAAGASAPADAVFRFTAGEAMQTSRPTSASGEDDDEDADRSEEYSDDAREGVRLAGLTHILPLLSPLLRPPPG